MFLLFQDLPLVKPNPAQSRPTRIQRQSSLKNTRSSSNHPNNQNHHPWGSCAPPLMPLIPNLGISEGIGIQRTNSEPRNPKKSAAALAAGNSKSGKSNNHGRSDVGPQPVRHNAKAMLVRQVISDFTRFFLN